MNIHQKTIATACLCLAALSIQAQTQVIAHRGYWKAEGSAQNSLASLRKAAEAKVYGSEFDVQMTADGIVVVNHDNTIGSTAISRATYEQIKESKLKNGETLPTLQAYLEEGRKLKDLQLILEIKKNKNKEHEDQAVKTIVKMVKDMGMEKQTEYISFSLNVCEQLVKATNGASEIFYINGDLSPQEAKAKGFTGIDYNFKVFDQHRPGSRFCHDRPPRRGHTTHERKIIADESFLKTHIRLQAFQIGRGKLLVQRQRLQLFFRPVFTAMLHYHPALIEIQIGMTAQDFYRHPVDQ